MGVPATCECSMFTASDMSVSRVVVRYHPVTRDSRKGIICGPLQKLGVEILIFEKYHVRTFKFLYFGHL